jgi:hypothetical protein
MVMRLAIVVSMLFFSVWMAASSPGPNDLGGITAKRAHPAAAGRASGEAATSLLRERQENAWKQRMGDPRAVWMLLKY